MGRRNSLNGQQTTLINLNNCLANNCNVGGHGARRCSSENRPNSDARDDFSFLAITFDVGHEMTRRLHHSKALVEAHLFRGVSSQSEHFPKIAFLDQNGQTELSSSRPDAHFLFFFIDARDIRPPTRPPAVPSRASMKK